VIRWEDMARPPEMPEPPRWGWLVRCARTVVRCARTVAIGVVWLTYIHARWAIAALLCAVVALVVWKL